MNTGNPGPAAALSEEASVQLRVAHLNILQGIIGRMAGYSSTVKNFSVTVTAASIALALDKDKEGPLWIAIGSAFLFCALDAYYHSHERGFRQTYNARATQPLNADIDLSVNSAPGSVARAFFSFSVWAFYLPQLLAAVILLAIRRGLI